MHAPLFTHYQQQVFEMFPAFGNFFKSHCKHLCTGEYMFSCILGKILSSGNCFPTWLLPILSTKEDLKARTEVKRKAEGTNT